MGKHQIVHSWDAYRRKLGQLFIALIAFALVGTVALPRTMTVAITATHATMSQIHGTETESTSDLRAYTVRVQGYQRSVRD